MSKSLIPVLTLGSLSLTAKESSKGKEYFVLDTNTVTIDSNVFRVFSSDVYETDDTGRSIKRAVLKLYPVAASIPVKVAPAVEEKRQAQAKAKAPKAKATPTVEDRMTAMEAGLTNILAALAK